MKRDQRREAVQLRRKGRSIKDIARVLRVSQSTASRWCADVKLTEPQKIILERKRRAAGIKALSPWIERNKQIKFNDLNRQMDLGRADIGSLSRRDLLMIGLGLYWGEGYKRGSQECGFTNSDPAIIRTALRWFRECYDITMDRVSARLTINSLYASEAARIQKIWSKETGIPITQFSDPTFITVVGSKLKDGRTYRGTLRIKIRNGTSLRRRILASIETLS